MARPVAARLLREWRTKAAKSQGEVAALFDVQQPTLSNYEKGSKSPRTALAVKIAAITDGAVPVEKWAVFEDDPTERLATPSANVAGQSDSEPPIDTQPGVPSIDEDTDPARFDTDNGFGPNHASTPFTEETPADV